MEIFQSGYAIALILLFFCGSIFVHELGHFLAAKWRGLKVLKFSIGFGPKIFGWKGRDGCEYRISLLPLGGYVALPQLADMGRVEGNESGDSELERMVRSLPKISYADKMIVSVAGALFNVLFAVSLAIVIWIVGIPTNVAYTKTLLGYVPQTLVVDGEKIENPAYAAGLRDGDYILAVDGTEVSEFGKILEYIAVGSGRDKDGKALVRIKYKRGDEVSETMVYPQLVKTNQETGDEIRTIRIFPAIGLKVAKVSENSPASRAGLKDGDEILRVNGKPVYSMYRLWDVLDNADEGETFSLDVKRGAEEATLSLVSEKVVVTRPLCEIVVDEKRKSKMTFVCSGLDADNPASVEAKGTLYLLDFTENDSLFEGLKRGMILTKVGSTTPSSIRELNTLVNHASGKNTTRMLLGEGMTSFMLPQGAASRIVDAQTQSKLGYVVDTERLITHPGVWEQLYGSLERTWSGLSSLLSPSSDIGLRHLSGPVGIGRVMYEFSLVDFRILLSFVVLVNVNLAILNLLPIPVLDGGHMLMATISKIMRRPIPDSVVAGVQGVFMLMILGIIIYVMYFDVMRWRGDARENADSKVMELYHISIPKK